MIKTIWKYELKITDSQWIAVPDKAKPLYVAMQGNNLCVWMLVDPTQSDVDMYVRIVGTGHSISDKEINSLYYLGSVQERMFVWHLFYEFHYERK